MSQDNVQLLHTMTAAQIAAWCQEHGMSVSIDYTTGGDGCLVPLIRARREIDPEHVPAFLRRQAE
jgi:hypothetical protein